MKTWFRFLSSHAEQTASLGVLRSFAPLLEGVDRDELINNPEKMFDQLLNIILKSDYTENFQVSQRTLFFSYESFDFLSYPFKVNYYVSVVFSLINVKKN